MTADVESSTFEEPETQSVRSTVTQQSHGYAEVPIDEEEEMQKGDALTWRPPYLRRRVLLAFLTLFCALLAALEGLNQLSERRQGLASPVESRRYSWTYGPTAVLTIIAAFWSRVEFQAKQSAPWITLRKKPMPASRTVLLDYISPLQLTSVYKALKNGDFIVGLASIGSILFKVLIIFSTSLLSLSRIEYHRPSYPLTMLDSFTSEDPLARLNSTDDMPFYILQGILAQNLTYPAGTNAQYAFQRFNAPDLSQNSVLTTTVDAVIAGLDCDPIEFDMTYFYYSINNVSYGPHAQTQFVAPQCVMPDLGGSVYHESSEFGDGNIILRGPRPYWVRFLGAACNKSTAVEQQRIVVSVVEFTRQPENLNIDWTNLSRMNKTVYANFTVSRSKSLSCKPSFEKTALMIKVNTSSLPFKTEITQVVGNAAEPYHLEGLELWDLAAAQFNFIALGTDPLENEIKAYADLNVEIDTQMLMGVMMQKETRPDIDKLFDGAVLRDIANSYYQAIGAQIAHRSLRSTVQSIKNGSTTTPEGRLLVQSGPLRAMEGCMGAIILLTGCLVTLVPREGIALGELKTIAALAAIIATSPGLISMLRGTGATELKVVKQRLLGHFFYSQVTTSAKRTGLRIQADGDDQYGSAISTRLGCTSRFLRLLGGMCVGCRRGRSQADAVDDFSYSWQPLPIKPWVQSSIFFVIIAVIVGLEVSLQISQKHNGLGDVNTDEHVHYVWVYIPALVMVSVGLTFASLDFTIRCLAPYSKLRLATGASLRQSIASNFLDQTAATTIVQSIRSKKWAVLATTIATLLGSALTIIASGMYSPQTVPHIQEVQLRMDPWIFDSTADLAQDYIDLGIYNAGLIIHANLSDPAWTYGDLTIPKLAVSSPQNSAAPEKLFSSDIGSYDSISLTAIIPAIQSRLSCALVKAAQLNATFSNSTDPGGYETSVTVHIPDGLCAVYNSTEGGTPLTTYASPDAFFGAAYTESGCLQYYMWGETGSLAEGIKHVAMLACKESVDQIQVKATFSYPGFQIDLSRPPVPQEPTRTPSSVYNDSFLDYGYLPVISNPPDQPDSFFSGVVYGKYGIPITDLGTPSTYESVMTAIERMHNIICTQLIGAFDRIPTNASTVGSLVPANVTNPNRLRLVQDPISTRVLEAMLATMLLLGALATFLVNPRHVVPKNPCSIAAVASLLADSEMLSEMDAAMHEMEDEEVEKNGVFRRIWGGKWFWQDKKRERSTPLERRWRMGWFERMETSSGSLVGAEEGNAEHRERIVRRFAIDAVEAEDGGNPERDAAETQRASLVSAEEDAFIAGEHERGLNEDVRHEGMPDEDVGSEDSKEGESVVSHRTSLISMEEQLDLLTEYWRTIKDGSVDEGTSNQRTGSQGPVGEVVLDIDVVGQRTSPVSIEEQVFFAREV